MLLLESSAGSEGRAFLSSPYARARFSGTSENKSRTDGVVDRNREKPISGKIFSYSGETGAFLQRASVIGVFLTSRRSMCGCLRNRYEKCAGKPRKNCSGRVRLSVHRRPNAGLLATAGTLARGTADIGNIRPQPVRGTDEDECRPQPIRKIGGYESLGAAGGRLVGEVAGQFVLQP